MVFDDWIDMNIQSGSQWDGFRHYGHQSQGRFYNNLTPEEVKSGKSSGSDKSFAMIDNLQVPGVEFKQFRIMVL